MAKVIFRSRPRRVGRGSVTTAPSRNLGTSLTIIPGGGGGGDNTLTRLILDTPAKISTLQQMKADYEVNTTNPINLGARIYKSIKYQADRTQTAGHRYADGGICAAWMYLATGDATWASKAYTTVMQDPANGWWSLAYNTISAIEAQAGYGNSQREWLIELIVIYSWIRPALSPSQRSTYMGALIANSNQVMNIGTTGGGGFRGGEDSDQSTMGYFFNAILHYYNVPENTVYGDRLNRSVDGTPMGGLIATSANLYETMRNSMKCYLTNFSHNSDWFESSEYNSGTGNLMASGLLALRSLVPGAIPEADAWFDEQAGCIPYMFGGNSWEDYNIWGDEQEESQVIDWQSKRFWKSHMSVGRAAWVGQGTSNGPLAQKWADDFITLWDGGAGASNGNLNYNGAFTSRTLVYVNPYASKLGSGYPWGSNTLAAKEITGLGQLWMRRGNADFLSLRGQHTISHIDHAWIPHTDITFNRGGERVFWHPVGYQNLSDSHHGLYCNTILYNGFGIYETQGLVRTGGGVDWCYTWSECSNVAWPEAGRGITSPFVTPAVTRMVFLKDAPTGWDVLVIRDDASVLNAQTTGGFSSYRNDTYGVGPYPHQTMINNAIALTGGCTKIRVFHTPFAIDSSSSSQITWTTAGNQDVVLKHLSPSTPGRSIVNANTIQTLVDNLSAGELTGKVVRLWNTTVQTTDTFVNVWMVGGHLTTPPTVTLLAGNNVQVGTRVISFNSSDVTVT